MPTGKLVLRSVDEFMADYKPVYQPIFPLFLKNSQQYSEEVGQLSFKRLEAVGDIRAKHITPKDTEMRQISVIEKSKVFKKYFLANQFVQSALQDQSRTEDVVRQVLDEHNKHMDSLLLEGEGTSNSTMVNNGLFWSADPNFIENASAEVAAGTDHLIDFYAKIMTQAEIAGQLEGEKLLMFYGSTVMPKANGLFVANSASFLDALRNSLGAGWNIAKMPTASTPSGANGFLIANLDQIKTHYTTLPQLKAQGVNEEKMYAWHNFLMGSSMVEVLASGALIKQPITFA